MSSVEPPVRFGVRERAIFARADGILADGDIVADALRRHGVPTGRIFPLATPIELSAQGLPEQAVSGPRIAHRLAYVGNLAPEHGAVDMLVAITRWAEQNKHRLLEIWWIGDGDLTGVLRAQPLPDNVSQTFLHNVESQKIAATLATCGMLVVPSLTGDHRCPVEVALASGLPVLGSVNDSRVRRFVREGFNGWLFDPSSPDDVLAALERAMVSTNDQRVKMQQNARCLSRPTFKQFEDRLHHAVGSVLHGSRRRSGRHAAGWAPARSAR